MNDLTAHNSSVYTEISSLQSLKAQVKSGDKDAIGEVAKQFEAIFLQMMLSGMRKTIQVNDEYSNEKSMYYDLFDKQVAMEMANNHGIGLSRFLMAQVNQTQHKADGQSLQAKASTAPVSPQQREFSVERMQGRHVQDPLATQAKADVEERVETKPQVQAQQKVEQQTLRFDSPMQFIKQLWNVASDVIAESGLNPKAVIAQAALETGWGRHIIKNSNGHSSFNLFGIKSGRSWNGEQVKANTLEFRDGVMMQSQEQFRSYASLQESVKDYVSFIKNNQRYSHAVEQQGNPERYAAELQRAGYATDPEYASKIIKIMNGKEFSQFFSSLDV